MYHYHPAGPSQLTLPDFPPPIEISEASRPPKRARHNEDATGDGDDGQLEDEINVAVGPQAKDKGKKKLGRPQKGCEECKRQVKKT